MKRILPIFMLLTSAATTIAGPVSKDAALQKAKEFMATKGKTIGASKLPAKTAARAKSTTQSSEDAAYYIFNADNNGGFVIASGDDRTDAVLGYSTSGSYNESDVPDALQAMLDSYAEQIAALDEGAEAASGADDESWTAIQPLITTTWGQGVPYNNNLVSRSNSTSNKKAYTGCVATAMAQVLYYTWTKNNIENPSATEILPYTYTYNSSITTDTLPSTTFDVANMKSYYAASVNSSDSVAAIAKLMQYAGASVGMSYQLSVSNSNTGSAAVAMIDVFGLDKNIFYARRTDYMLREWHELVYNELAAARPVQYGGQSGNTFNGSTTTSGGGHSFIIDGYDGNGGWHVNWGWNGNYDGYYKLEILNPETTTEAGASSSGTGYSYSQGAIIGVQPSTGEDADRPLKLSGYFLSFDNDAKTVYAQFYNYSGQVQTFSYGLEVKNLDTNSIILYKTKRITNLKVAYGNSNSAFDLTPNDSLFTAGTYKISLVSKVTNTDTWHQSAADNTYLLLTVDEDGNFTFSYPNKQTVTEFIFTGNKYINVEQNVDLTIENSGEEFSGMVYLFMSKTDVKGTYRSMNGAYIEADGTATISLPFTANTFGTYNVWAAIDQNGENVIGQTTVDITYNTDSISSTLSGTILGYTLSDDGTAFSLTSSYVNRTGAAGKFGRGVGIIDEDGNVAQTLYITSSGVNHNAGNGYWSARYTLSSYLKDEYLKADTIYRIAPISLDYSSEGLPWKNSSIGEVYAEVTTAKNESGETIVTSITIPDTGLEVINFSADSTVIGSNNTLSYTIKNNSSRTFIGTVYIYSSSQTAPILSQNIRISGGYSYTPSSSYKAVLNVSEAGNYTIWFTTASGSNIFATEEVEFTDEATGIESIDADAITDADNGDDIIYTLQGIRVERPQQSGVYIVNGKKVLVK